MAQMNMGDLKLIFSEFSLSDLCFECLKLISIQADKKQLKLNLNLDEKLPHKINSD